MSRTLAEAGPTLRVTLILDNPEKQTLPCIILGQN
jgi:hypothetical protein